MATEIRMCTCKHPGQDKLHGQGKRVKNYARSAKKDGGVPGWRCTVCGKIERGLEHG